jgi:hypothetical protein
MVIMRVLCVIATELFQVQGMEVWPVDGYSLADTRAGSLEGPCEHHEAVQDDFGSIVSLLGVAVIEDAGKVRDEQRGMCVLLELCQDLYFVIDSLFLWPVPSPVSPSTLPAYEAMRSGSTGGSGGEGGKASCPTTTSKG